MPTPPRSLDDMPLAAYGGSGMQDEDDAKPDPEPAADPAANQPATAATAAPSPAMAATAARSDDLPVPEDERPAGPSPLSRAGKLLSRVVHLLRTSRVAAGAGFAVVIVVGLVILSSGGASPAATAATPSSRPSAQPTVVPPSGDAELMVSGAVTGTFPLSGQTGGQQVGGGTVGLAWADATQTVLNIAGPLDRGTRATDEHLTLSLVIGVNGVPVTFTSSAGECTIGMAEVASKVQGSFTCHKLKSADGKLTIEATGTYRS